MVSTEFAKIILGTILEYAELIVVILIIYKLIRLLMNLGGKVKDSLSGNKNNKNKTPGDPSKNPPENDPKNPPTENEDDEKKVKENSEKKGLDIENPGLIKILVTKGENDSPIAGAKLRVYAFDIRFPNLVKLFKKDPNKYAVINNKITGPDGVWPSRSKGQVIGSGWVTIDIWTKFGNKRTTDYVQPNNSGEAQLIQVSIDDEGEKTEGFEPSIINIRQEDTALELTGVVR